MTPLEETEETVELNELENKLEKQLYRIDSEKHPGDIKLDSETRFPKDEFLRFLVEQC